MTAVDVDALAKLREAHEEWSTNGLDVDTTNGEVWNNLFRRPRWMDEDDVRRLVALHNALPDLLAEVRRGRALREAVDGLAQSWEEGERGGWVPAGRGAEVGRARDSAHAVALRAVVAAVDGGEH